jgi:6-phosphogluconolactonase
MTFHVLHALNSLIRLRTRQACRLKTLAAVSMTLLLGTLAASCGGSGGGGSPTYTIGGSVDGLAGSGLILQDNGANDLAIAGNGSFSFPSSVQAGTAYSVAVKTEPSSPAQTCSVANPTGIVGALNETTIVVTCRTLYAVGGVLNGLSLSRFTSGVTLQDNGGDDLVVSKNGSFQFSTPIPDGGSFSVVITKQPAKPSETCTVASGAGTVKDSAVSSIVVNCEATPPQFAYAANTIGNISEYTVAATGALSLVGTYPTISSGPYSITVDPSGQFVYAGNIRGGVEAYSINQASGVLAEITGSPFQDIHSPSAVAVDPTSRYVYVANTYGGPTNQGSVSVYAINGATGALNEISGSPYTVNYNPSSIAMDSAGRFVYLAGSSGEVAFAINGATGALTPVPGSPFPPTNAAAVSINPVRPFGYSAYTSGVSVGLASYSVNTSTGTLSQIENLAYTAAVQAGPIAVDPTGKFVYVLTAMGGAPLIASIEGYSANVSTGALTPLNAAPFVGPTGPHAMVVDRAGDFLFVTGDVVGSLNGAVTVYAIDKVTGNISEVAGGPYPAGDFPGAMAVY